MEQFGIRKLIEGHSIVPVVNFTQIEQVAPFCDYLIEQQIEVIEITLRSECALQAIELVKKNYDSSLLLGVGTILNPTHIKQVADLGVDFLVSPGYTDKLAQAFEQAKIPFLPGIASPSEIIKAMEYGWNTLKLFPANVAGGLTALKAYKSVFSTVKFCPTGGLTKENHSKFLAMENVICVGGSWLHKEFKEIKKEG